TRKGLHVTSVTCIGFLALPSGCNSGCGSYRCGGGPPVTRTAHIVYLGAQWILVLEEEESQFKTVVMQDIHTLARYGYGIGYR
ncbi:hypothetical protein A2U01_0028277, partial [Trifolium medium]|nr:hypothetical protein [Trifolium medium]